MAGLSIYTEEQLRSLTLKGRGGEPALYEIASDLGVTNTHSYSKEDLIQTILDHQELEQRMGGLNMKGMDNKSTKSVGSSSKPAKVLPMYYRGITVCLTPTPAQLVQKHKVAPSKLPAPPDGTKLMNFNDWIKSVEDQGKLGTCASFSTCECLKLFFGERMSQPHLIVQAEEDSANGGNCLNDGLPVGAAMHAAVHGIVKQAVWPYSDYLKAVAELNPSSPTDDKDNNLCVTPPAAVAKAVKRDMFHFSGAACLFGAGHPIEQGMTKAEAVIMALNKWSVLVLVIPAFPSWMDSGAAVDVANEKRVGLHAVALWHHKTKQGKVQLWFKNSWGPTWGRDGHGTISEAFINQYAVEAWVGFP